MLSSFGSMTAFYLDQVNRRPWTDDLNIPRKGYQQARAEMDKLRQDILDSAKELGEPFTAKQMEIRLGSDKSRTRSVLEWHERNGNVTRVNVRGRLHWRLI